MGDRVRRGAGAWLWQRRSNLLISTSLACGLVILGVSEVFEVKEHPFSFNLLVAACGAWIGAAVDASRPACSSMAKRLPATWADYFWADRVWTLGLCVPTALAVFFSEGSTLSGVAALLWGLFLTFGVAGLFLVRTEYGVHWRRIFTTSVGSCNDDSETLEAIDIGFLGIVPCLTIAFACWWVGQGPVTAFALLVQSSVVIHLFGLIKTRHAWTLAAPSGQPMPLELFILGFTPGVILWDGTVAAVLITLQAFLIAWGLLVWRVPRLWELVAEHWAVWSFGLTVIIVGYYALSFVYAALTNAREAIGETTAFSGEDSRSVIVISLMVLGPLVVGSWLEDSRAKRSNPWLRQRDVLQRMPLAQSFVVWRLLGPIAGLVGWVLFIYSVGVVGWSLLAHADLVPVGSALTMARWLAFLAMLVALYLVVATVLMVWKQPRFLQIIGGLLVAAPWMFLFFLSNMLALATGAVLCLVGVDLIYIAARPRGSQSMQSLPLTLRSMSSSRS